MADQDAATGRPTSPLAGLPDPELVRDADVTTNAWMLTIGGTEQSYVDLDDPTHLEFDYVQRLAEAIDLVAPVGERIRIVHIGGAGLTVPRYVAHTRPTSAQVVLEPDTALTELIRERLPLPRNSGIKIRPIDGRAGIAALGEDYADVVVLDAFYGSQVPAELTTWEFLTDCRRVVAPGGSLMINVTDRGPFDYSRRVAAGVQSVYAHAMFGAEMSTIKGRRFGNVVLIGSDRSIAVDQLQTIAARSAFPYRMHGGSALARLISGAVPFTDADSSWSPPPPSGRTLFL